MEEWEKEWQEGRGGKGEEEEEEEDEVGPVPGVLDFWGGW